MFYTVASVLIGYKTAKVGVLEWAWSWLSCEDWWMCLHFTDNVVINTMQDIIKPMWSCECSNNGGGLGGIFLYISSVYYPSVLVTHYRY